MSQTREQEPPLAKTFYDTLADLLSKPWEESVIRDEERIETDDGRVAC